MHLVGSKINRISTALHIILQMTHGIYKQQIQIRLYEGGNMVTPKFTDTMMLPAIAVSKG